MVSTGAFYTLHFQCKQVLHMFGLVHFRCCESFEYGFKMMCSRVSCVVRNEFDKEDVGEEDKQQREEEEEDKQHADWRRELHRLKRDGAPASHVLEWDALEPEPKRSRREPEGSFGKCSKPDCNFPAFAPHFPCRICGEFARKARSRKGKSSSPKRELNPEPGIECLVEPESDQMSVNGSCSSRSDEERWYQDRHGRMRLKVPRRPRGLLRMRSPRRPGAERFQMLQHDKCPWLEYQNAEV